MRKVVIIGGVAGGASCAARLRRLDEEAQIILLERGPYISYANCGLPYHISGVIPHRASLLLQSPQSMQSRFNVDVRIHNEAISIDRERKTVRIKRLKTGEIYEESYDTLVIATGCSPVRPPIPGIDSPRVRTLWTVPDTDHIRALVQEQGGRTAAVIGGGFIGLEMAESLHHAGVKVSIIEMLNQVMAPLDYEIALLLHKHIAEHGVSMHLDDGVMSFTDTGRGVDIQLKSRQTLSVDFAILCIGVRPNSELARAAGLAMNERGGIIVDDGLRTSDASIYAVGDVIEVEDYMFKDRAMIPLAGPANKQGRIAADNIAGGDSRYQGTQGTAVAKVFELSVASTGANEKALIRRGLVRGEDYEHVTIMQNSHASYYPGAWPLVVKLLFSMDGERIFGAQIVGRHGVDKRIDTIAVTMRLGGGIKALTELELAYAPPYSSAKDPVNMAGFVAENLLRGKAYFAAWDAVETRPDALLLDVREIDERAVFSIPGSLHIPLGELRGRLGELDTNSEIIVLCAVGVRAYNAARILMLNGFHKVMIYPGGASFYRATHFSDQEIESGYKPQDQAAFMDGHACCNALDEE